MTRANEVAGCFGWTGSLFTLPHNDPKAYRGCTLTFDSAKGWMKMEAAGGSATGRKRIATHRRKDLGLLIFLAMEMPVGERAERLVRTIPNVGANQVLVSVVCHSPVRRHQTQNR